MAASAGDVADPQHLFQERQMRGVTANTRAGARVFADFAGTRHLSVNTAPYAVEQADQELTDLTEDRVTGAVVPRAGHQPDGHGRPAGVRTCRS